MLVQILKAQAVNEAVGGMWVTPFDVDELPEEWVEACNGLAVDVPMMRSKLAEVERVKDRLRKRR